LILIPLQSAHGSVPLYLPTTSSELELLCQSTIIESIVAVDSAEVCLFLDGSLQLNRKIAVRAIPEVKNIFVICCFSIDNPNTR
jgi:hypothetical protein